MSTAQCEKIGSRWVARVSYEQRQIAKNAGFRWDPNNRQWYTTDPAVAERLGDPNAAEKLAAERQAREAEKLAREEASRAATSDAEIPVPDGLAYLPYQRAGIEFARNVTAGRGILFGDEMGLGKTVQAIGVINADESIKRILVICPASLRLNWQRELQRWLVRPLKIAIASSTVWPHGFDVVIINYDILQKQAKNIQQEWDLVIIDEAHYCKNPDAKRTKLVCGADAKRNGDEAVPGLKARVRIALTGTPIPNRPVEGWSIFHYLAPDVFPKFWYYAKDFCAAHNNGYGWDFSGACNLDKLQSKLRSSIMVRRKKADVLTELPAKRRQLVELSQNGAAAVVARENAAWDRKEQRIAELRAKAELAKAESDEAYQKAVLELRNAARVAFEEMSALRHDTALAKVPYVIDHINASLEEEGHKIVVFAHHRDVIAAILEALRTAGVDAVSITGDTPMDERQRAVDNFQSDETIRVFVGNIQAAGVGLTLTAASHVIFAELDWVPGNVTQAEDRCHRIGQRDSVLVQHLVIDGSLDAKMAKTLIDKQAVIDAALDDQKPALAEETETPEVPATRELSRAAIEIQAPAMSAEKIAAAHRAMQILASMDGDHARDLNGYGFNKADCFIGHSLADRGSLSPKQAVLAAKLANKYRRQLPIEIVETIKA